MVRREPAVAVTSFPSGSTKYDAVARQIWRQGSDVRDEGTFLLGRDCPTVLDRREGVKGWAGMWPVLSCWRGAQVEVLPLLPTVGAD